MKTNTTERLIAGLVLMTSVLIITLSTGATFKPSGFAQMESQIELPFMDKKPAVPVTDPEPVAEPAAASEHAVLKLLRQLPAHPLQIFHSLTCIQTIVLHRPLPFLQILHTGMTGIKWI